MARAEVCVDTLVPQADMFSAWRAAIKSVGGAVGPAAAAKGPAGAAIAAAQRIDWRMHGWHALRELNGYVLGVCEEAPVTI